MKLNVRQANPDCSSNESNIDQMVRVSKRCAKLLTFFIVHYF